MKLSLVFSVFAAVASIVVAVPAELAASKLGNLAVDGEYAYPGKKQQRDVEVDLPVEGEYAYHGKLRRAEDDRDFVVDGEYAYPGKKQPQTD